MKQPKAVPEFTPEAGRCSERGCPYRALVGGKCRGHYHDMVLENSIYSSGLSDENLRLAGSSPTAHRGRK